MNEEVPALSRLGSGVPTHTPGPWALHDAFAYIVPAEHANRPIGAAEDPEVDLAKYAQEICALRWPDHRTKSEMLANARLIASAPDLLDVAREALAMAKLAATLTGCRSDDDFVWAFEEKVKAALAKVEGAVIHPPKD